MTRTLVVFDSASEAHEWRPQGADQASREPSRACGTAFAFIRRGLVLTGMDCRLYFLA